MRPLLVGVTGGIGSGKTTVCNVFQTLGIPVYNSDLRARELMETSDKIRTRVQDLFGPESYSDSGLNRQFISTKVFNDQELLNQLNAVVHPVVGEDFKSWVDRNNFSPYLIKEAALIFENGIQSQLDHVVLVTASKSSRADRVLKRDPQRTVEQIHNIMDKQMSEDEKKKLAHSVIINEDQPILKDLLNLHLSFINHQ